MVGERYLYTYSYELYTLLQCVAFRINSVESYRIGIHGQELEGRPSLKTTIKPSPTVVHWTNVEYQNKYAELSCV